MILRSLSFRPALSPGFLAGVLLALAGGLVGGIPGPACAQTDFTVLGNGFTGRPYRIVGDLVLETSGLVEGIRDFRDPQKPAWIGWHDHSSSSYWEQVVSDGTIVVGINSDSSQGPVGFSVADFSNPRMPAELIFQQGFRARSAWLRDGALLVFSDNIVVVYDLADPVSPVLTTVLLLGYHLDNRHPVSLGTRLYLVDQDDTLRQLDVSDPLQPVDLGVLPGSGGRIDAVAGGGEHLYLLVTRDLAGGTAAVDLVVWDVTGGNPPVETDRRELVAGPGARGRILALEGDLLLASASGAPLRAFDLADPALPAPGWSVPLEPDNVAVTGSAILAFADDELLVYERVGPRTPPGDPARRSVLPPFRTVVGEGPLQIAQLQRPESRLVPVDVSLPAQPRIGTPIETQLSGTLNYADGLGLMIKDDVGVQLLDLSDPLEPEPRGGFPLPAAGGTAKLWPGGVATVAFRGKTSFVDLYDVRDPDRPVQAVRIEALPPLVCDGRWLVCGAGFNLPVYKLDDGFQPTMTGSIESSLKMVRSAVILDDFIYLVGNLGLDIYGMEVHRLTDPPEKIRDLRLPPIPIRADRLGDLLFIRGGDRCEVYDLADRVDPRHSGSFSLLGAGPTGFATNGSVATVSGMLFTVRVGANGALPTPRADLPSGLRVQPARPNPFNPRTSVSFTIDRERELAVGVYDARGRRVADLAGGRFPAGTHTVTWDGQARGAPAASGVYFIRVHGPGAEAVQAVTLLK